jgi:class 3 adenylate cyclase
VIDEESMGPDDRPTAGHGAHAAVDLDALAAKRTLSFPQPLEIAFRADYATRWRAANRAAFVFGFATYAGFGMVDIFASPNHLGVVWMIRGVGCLIVAGYLLATYTPAYPRIMQRGSAIVVFALSVTIVAMELAVEPDEAAYRLYIFGLAAVTTFGYAAPRLRFWHATTAGWCGLSVSLIVGIDQGVWGSPNARIDFLVIEALLVAVNIAGMIGAYLMEAGDRRAFIQELILEREHERSEALLLNILPESVSERLKRGEDVAEAFDECTLVFADLVDFTPFSASRTPSELMGVLNSIFSSFDAIADRHGLEKIKTMGDCYMAVAGVPEPVPDHAERVAAAALDMLSTVQGLDAISWRPLQLRVGMHTGPVVAGVIGNRKFSYDLWGDTVNTASRMETQGEPGRIRVTRDVYERLRLNYRFEGPQRIQIKGKGEMETYFLIGPTTDAGRPDGRAQRLDRR